MPRLFVLLSILSTAAVAQVPLIITNAASFGAAIAPGSIAQVSYNLGGPGGQPPFLPGADRVTVLFQTANDTRNRAPVPALRIVSSLSAWVVVPDSLPLGSVHMTLLADAKEVGAGNATLVRSAPGLFAVGGNGFGPAVAQNLSATGATLNSLTNPAVPNDFVTLWLTGLGDATAADVTVDLAGRQIPAAYAGHHASPGLDQVNLRLPASPYFGCYVPLSVRVRDAVSNTVTLAINATPGACAHPLGLSYTDLRTLDQGGTIVTPSLHVYKALLFPPPGEPAPDVAVPHESASIDFISRSAEVVYLLAGPQMPPEPPSTCTVAIGNLAVGVRGGLFSEGVDVGRSMTLAGPNGQRLALPIADRGLSTKPLPYFSGEAPADQQPFFAAGTWTLSGDGGSDLLPFQFPFHLPPPLRLLNRDGLATVRRSTDLTVRWDPLGYGPGDVMAITVANPSGAVSCRTPASSGSLTFPRDLLGRLSVTDTLGFITLGISPLQIAREQFSLPRPTGEQVHGVVSYSFGDLIRTQIQ